MSAHARPELSPEEYLDAERVAPYKSEYHDGHVVALAGASDQHDQIVVNVLAPLHRQLRTGSCRVRSSDMRVWIPRIRRFLYPDVSVICGPTAFLDQRTDVLLNPLVLIEVLSSSTEAYDRGDNFEYYQSIESFQEYVLISQTAPRIEHYVKQGPFQWLYEPMPGGAVSFRFATISCELPISELYEGVGASGG